MKAITTAYRGPTNTQGARIVASDGDGNTVSVSYDHGAKNPHADAAIALARKMNWTGELVEGHTKHGRIYVWLAGDHFTVE